MLMQLLTLRRSGFQSTLPVRGATVTLQQFIRLVCISIHAPREGSDPASSTNKTDLGDFNPRSP